MIKRKGKADINMMIAIGVLLASIGTLIVATRQASIMNEQTKILLDQTKSSLWPSLSLEMNRNIQQDGIKKYSYVISNRGTGPAIVEKTYLAVDEKFVSNWSEFYDALEVPESVERKHSIDNILNRVIKPGEDFKLIDWSSNYDVMSFIYAQSDRISIRICYKSVFGDYWQVSRVGFKNNLEENVSKQNEECQDLQKKAFVQ